MFLLLIIFLLSIIYLWFRRNRAYFKKIGIPYDETLLLVGNVASLMLQKESMIDILSKGYNKYKESKVYGFFNLFLTSYVITDPVIIKAISIKDFEYFMNRSPVFGTDKHLKRSIAALNDKKWRDMRNTLSPIFTSSRMKMMYGLLNDQSDDFIKFMHEQAEKGQNLDIEVGNLFSRYTADGIATAVLGFVGDSVRNTDSELYKVVRKLDSEVHGKLGALKFLLTFLLPNFTKVIKLNIISNEIAAFFKRVVVDAMNEREKKNISRPDIIQLLLQARKGQLRHNDADSLDKDVSNFATHTEYEINNEGSKVTRFEDAAWSAQGLMFFSAGFDTSRDLIQITFYELADNQDIQQTLYEEIESVLKDLNGNPISYEALHKMKFLNMVVSESLRKWPPGPFIDRKCGQDYKLDLGDGKSIVIRKNQIIIFPVFSIHRDPEYFEDPEKFDPYRFSDERKGSIIPETLISFGSGPRFCIGYRFALMSVKMILFKLISEFKIDKCEKTPKTLSTRLALTCKFREKIYLNFTPRKGLA